jgi:hypothetical protein
LNFTYTTYNPALYLLKVVYAHTKFSRLANYI